MADAQLHEALDDEELAILDAYLARVKGGLIRDTEMIDGFFAALACCPDLVMPSEFLEVLQSGETEEGDLVFQDVAEGERFVGLVMRHRNHVNGQLTSGEIYLPLLMEDDDGRTPANAWAQGFLTGMDLRHEIWSEVFEDEDRGGPLVPIMALAYEHHPDPGMRPFEEPVSDDKRTDLIAHAAAGVMQLHAMFREDRDLYLPDTLPGSLPIQNVLQQPLSCACCSPCRPICGARRRRNRTSLLNRLTARMQTVPSHSRQYLAAHREPHTTGSLQ